MHKLSVVVIIYKVEKYLNQCLESILNQTYRDFELILVDDGSPDKCPEICDEFALKDTRIKVIHQENQGSVSARWNGFLCASGEYVSFIDGDDWIDHEMYERLISMADQKTADIVVTGYKEVFETETVLQRCYIDSGIYSGEKLEWLYKNAIYTGKFYEAGINPSLWNKLIKRSLLLDDYIPADKAIKMGDDAAVCYPAIARAKSVCICNEFHPYNYRIVCGSQSRAFDIEYFDRAIKLFRGLADNLKLNSAMINGLYPYSLFITKVGIYMLFARDNGLGLKEKKRILYDYYAAYSELLDTQIVRNESDNDLVNEKMLCLFSQGNLNRLIQNIYFEKISRRLKRS